MHPQLDKLKEIIRIYFKSYLIIIVSLLIGITTALLAFAIENPLIPGGWATAIILVLIFGNIIYDHKRNSGCSKCGNWMNIEQTDQIEKGGMLMPNGIDTMRKYRCNNCGHTWTEFFKRHKNSHF